MPAKKISGGEVGGEGTGSSTSGIERSSKRDLRLSFLISDVSRLQFRLVDELMKPLGVTRSQWFVVTFLSRREGLTQSELAIMLDMSRVNLGTLLDRLELSNIVTRTPHPVDGRAKCVSLTARGRRLTRTIAAQEERLSRTIFADLNSDERDTLVDLLRRIRTTFKVLNLGPPEE